MRSLNQYLFSLVFKRKCTLMEPTNHIIPKIISIVGRRRLNDNTKMYLVVNYYVLFLSLFGLVLNKDRRENGTNLGLSSNIFLPNLIHNIKQINFSRNY